MSTITDPRWFWSSPLPPSARWQAQCARDRPQCPTCVRAQFQVLTELSEMTLGLTTEGQGPCIWVFTSMTTRSWLTTLPPLSSQALPREPPHSTQATSKDKANSMEATERRRQDLPPSSSGLTAMSRQAFWMFLEVLSAKSQVRHDKDLSHGPEKWQVVPAGFQDRGGAQPVWG